MSHLRLRHHHVRIAGKYHADHELDFYTTMIDPLDCWTHSFTRTTPSMRVGAKSVEMACTTAAVRF